MSFQKSTIVRTILFCLSLFMLSTVIAAQDEDPILVIVNAAKAKPVAAGNNLYCAGFIQQNAISTGNKIIAGQDEADQFNYSQNDFLYINMGSDKGVNVGDNFAVVRPRGAVKSPWSRKDNIGFYVQEVGSLEVLKVKQNVSAVRVKFSCDSFLLGDLVQLKERRVSPLVDKSRPFDIFGDPSGKATGRIVLARDSQEMITRDQIAYVDLGADDNVSIGDRLTVFRPIAKGNLTLKPDREAVSSRDYGFQSDEYKGGKFSNQSARKSGENADGQEVRTRDVRNDRPKDLRKVVGEAVVLNVKERTATIVITRTAQEIHTGDWVEIQ